MIYVVYQLPYACNVASRLRLPLLFNIATDEEPSYNWNWLCYSDCFIL